MCSSILWISWEIDFLYDEFICSSIARMPVTRSHWPWKSLATHLRLGKTGGLRCLWTSRPRRQEAQADIPVPLFIPDEGAWPKLPAKASNYSAIRGSTRPLRSLCGGPNVFAEVLGHALATGKDRWSELSLGVSTISRRSASWYSKPLIYP